MLVLWVVTLLTIIAVGLTATQRTESTLAANQVATARFRALSEAGIAYTVLNLLGQPSLVQGGEPAIDVWVPDGVARPWRFAGEPLTIAIVNEQSLIDLNKASKELFDALFFAAGVPEGEIELLVDAILDWRDEDDLHLLNGAEDPDYEAAGIPYGAKDGPFDSVEELRQVLGFHRDLYRTIAPVLTVNADSEKVEAEFAPPLVSAALEGTTLEEIELRLEEQEAASELSSGVTEPGRPISRGGPLYRVRVSRGGRGEAPMSMEALVRLEAGASPPFRVLWRRYGLTASRPQPATGE
jgi:general secretion pathway protein K